MCFLCCSCVVVCVVLVSSPMQFLCRSFVVLRIGCVVLVLFLCRSCDVPVLFLSCDCYVCVSCS